MNQKSDSNKGFTLVELAIVMVVIGLLISGILKGAEFITTSKVNRTIQDIKIYETALITYREKYNALPGDHNSARLRIPGCTIGNNCTNGDGNGIIAAADWNGFGVTWQTRFATLPGVIPREATQLWKHLAMADLISGVNPASDPASPAWGMTHPSSPFGGGYEMYYDGMTTVGGNQNIIRLSLGGIFAGTWEHLLNPGTGAMIDRKMDDGLPNSGYVIMNYGRTVDRCKVNGPGGTIVYDEGVFGAQCTLYYAVPK